MSEHIAILVVHGIGEEQPYGTLDQFTRGLLDQLDPPPDGSGKIGLRKITGFIKRALKPSKKATVSPLGSHAVDGAGPSGAAAVPEPLRWTITPVMSMEPDSTWPGHEYSRVAYKIAPPAGTVARLRSDGTEYEDITLFEYYWSPITKNKVKYTTSLLFLIKAGLQPFKYLAANTVAISTANAGHKISDTRVGVFLRELRRQAMLFLPLLLLLAGLFYGLYRANELLEPIKKSMSDPAVVIIAVLVAVRILYVWTNFNALRQRSWRRRKLPETWAWRGFLAFGLVFHLFFWPYSLGPLLRLLASLGSWGAHLSAKQSVYLAVHHIHWFTTIRAYVDHYLSPSNPWTRFFLLSDKLTPLLLPVLFLGLAWCVRFILVTYVGDVAVYANPNQLSENYEARAQVLDGCTTTLAGILKQVDGQDKPRFNRVLVAGHSLGSVIAYDTLNSLLNLARTGSGITGDDLKRLRGLVTFGSPLNKIYYFFRELDDQRATLRHSTLDLLHSFRLKPSLATNQPPLLAGVAAWKDLYAALAERFTWINAYSPTDPISGRLLFYDVGKELPAGGFNNDAAQISLSLGLFGAAHLKYWSSPAFYQYLRKNLL